MHDTLAALHAAVIENPADRTVRLVYADALDESGDPANSARAEFIRKQIALESLPESDPQRDAVIDRCDELFLEHWTDWWRPVCAAAGFPEPYLPKQRLRDRARRLVRGDRRHPGSPYTRTIDFRGVCSINSEEHGFTAQFIGGFPELLAVHEFTIDTLPGQIRDWFAGAPFHRLRFTANVSEFEWTSIDGPPLAKLTELRFDQLSEATAALAARSEHLRGLPALKALLLHPAPAGMRHLVAYPTWAGLRSLTLTGVTPPNAIQELVERCTLESLESLSLALGEEPEWPSASGLSGIIGTILSQTLAMLGRGPVYWPDYWPALTALARSPLLPRLRRLHIADADADLRERAAGTYIPESATEGSLFPNALVTALADGLNADRLERLELPRARLSGAARAALLQRFGSRLVLA